MTIELILDLYMNIDMLDNLAKIQSESEDGVKYMILNGQTDNPAAPNSHEYKSNSRRTPQHMIVLSE